jgi:hypothetical protein
MALHYWIREVMEHATFWMLAYMSRCRPQRLKGQKLRRVGSRLGLGFRAQPLYP